MTRLVSSRWLGERGERLLCFPTWGISETTLVTLASWYFVVLLTKVFALAFKKMNKNC